MKRKRYLIYFLSIVIIVSMVIFVQFFFMSSEEVQVVSVASVNVYYVSTTGSDEEGNGSFENPWNTIQKAADEMASGDITYIREGIYRETVVPANSGVTFQNYENETVTVSGTDQILNWTLDQGSVYKASIRLLSTNNQIFVGGVMMNEARWPNQAGQLLSTTLSEATEGSYTSITDSDIPDHLTGADLRGAKIWYLGGVAWVAHSAIVNSYDESNKRLLFNASSWQQDSVWYNAKEGTKYYIYGVKALLDSETEWWYDYRAKELYLWAPDGADPNNLLVEAKVRSNGFDLSGKSDIQIKGINLFGTSILTDSNTENLLIHGMHAKYVAHNMYLTNAFDYGMTINGTNNEIHSSEFAYSSGGLLTVNGSNNRIINSHIHSGNYGASWSGLLNLNGSKLVASHNTIHSSGRDVLQLRNIQESLIQNNRIYNAGLLTTDNAAIYTADTDGMGTEIRYNKVHDANAHNGIGIYLDNFTNNFLVHHNVIWNTNRDPIRFNLPNEYLLAFNNTAGLNTNFVTSFGEKYSDGSNGMFGTRYLNNIFTSQIYPIVSDRAQLGFNIVQGTDPQFVDAENFDYRILPGSVAVDNGMIIPGITDNFTGLMPDIGAYQLGSDDFQAGHDFANPPTNIDYQMSTTPYNNQVYNGGFETNSFIGWSVKGNPEIVTDNGWVLGEKADVRSHKKAAKLSSAGDEISQIMTGLQPNTSYVFSVWIKLKNASGSGIVGVRNYGGSAIEESVDSTSWTRISIEFTTEDNESSAEIYVMNTSADGDNDVPKVLLVDDFGLTLPY